jgi:H+/Na+-translocating ferredoxin:NAD+ oxidoreductase subunit D
VSDPKLLVRTGPFLKRELTTPRLMADVAVATLPVVAAGAWFFGIGALLIVLASSAGACVTEWALAPGRPRGRSLLDASALLTGLLLGLTLPPGLPLWMAFLGGIVAIGLGKTIWGGLGHNLFNPALVGRAFLQAAFPTALTTWAPAGGAGGFLALRGPVLSPPFLVRSVDAVTAATPLALHKFDHVSTAAGALLAGNTAGSIGETSGAILLLCGAWLVARRAFEWRGPLAMLLAVAAFSAVLHVVDPVRYPSAPLMLLSGGLLFGAVFMVTDPVTSPTTPRGAWIFGAGAGLLVVLIRIYGGLPEGVMYAILLMNATVPHIDRATQPRAFGRGRKA